MNLARKFLHGVMEKSGLDDQIDAAKVNFWLEKQRQRYGAPLAVDACNMWLKDALENGRAFAAGKIGDIELMALGWHLRIRRFYKYTWQPPTFGELQLHSNAGVFPRDETIFHRFSDRFLDALQKLDLAAVWFNPGENEILQRFAPDVTRTQMAGLEPWFSPSNPWSAALAGKRVLVIHPFTQTIKEQFQRREQVWAGMPKVLPAFKLRLLRSPYGFTNTGFPDWLEMLKWMEQEMEDIEAREGFDVALIGCGAAGIPLAAKAKAMGKAGIHLGGPLQLLFGIRGRRWDARPEFQHLFNDMWRRPDDSERPAEFKTVDQGGYW